MYSREAIDAYKVLLKEAGLAVAPEFHKMAGFPWGSAASGAGDVFRSYAASKMVPKVLPQMLGPGTAAAEELAKHFQGLAPKGLGMRHILGGGALAAGTGLGGYAYGKHIQGEHNKTTRNLAFGAGAATGFALPGMLRGAADAAQNVALTPNSLFSGMGGGRY